MPLFFQGLKDEMKVVAGLQHAHLLGTAITTRHFRNGIELEPLMDDPYYDFNFQQFRPMVKERVIKPVRQFTTTLNNFQQFRQWCKNYWK